MNRPWGGRALLLLFFSGAAGLAHQVVWTRRLVDVLGASADTFSKVVGAFCVGLALGGAWSALKPAPPKTAWRRVALAEFCVAALGLLALFSIPIADHLRPILGDPALVKWSLPALLVTPPAIAMGLVLPAVLAATPGRRTSVWAYAVNTLGGVVGIAVIVFWGLPAGGLTQSGLLTCAVSFALATAALLIYRFEDAPARTERSEITDVPVELSRTSTNVLAFTSGFLVLGLEVVAQQQFAQVTINSHFSSSTVLAVVLIALGGASLLVAAQRQPPSLRLGLALAAAAWLLQPSTFLWLRPDLQIIPYELAPTAYFTDVVLLAAGTLLPGFFATGLLFPTLLSGAGSAKDVARLLALNGLGGWLGSELTQGIVLPQLGLWRTVLAASAVYTVLLGSQSLGRGRRSPPRGSPAWQTFGVAIMVVVSGLAWIRASHSPQVSPAPGERVIDLAVGREGVVATVSSATNDWRIIFNNTYTLGGSRAQMNQERQAHLPLLLHGHPRAVALLGVATGSTLAGATLSPAVEHIDAFELSPWAARFAEKHFAPFNRNVFRDPRVTVTLEDARWSIAQKPAQYDVVIGDLFLPWRTGEGRLYSQEHFAAVRRALRSDGLFCQWLPLFQLTRPQFATIARTFDSVFTNTFLLRGDFYPDLPIIGLCAFADGRPLSALDWSEISQGAERLRSTPVTDPLVRHAEGVAMCVIGPLPPLSPGPLNTLGNSRLEWDAGRNIVGLRQPWFIGVPAAEYLRDIFRANSNSLPGHLRHAQDSGLFFQTLEIAAKVNAPVLANLRTQISERLPPSLVNDGSADWAQWPGRVKPFAAHSNATEHRR